MIVMNEETLFKRIDNNKRIHMIQDLLLPDSYLNKVVKMHQQTTWHLPYNWDTFTEQELYTWCDLVNETDSLPDYVEDRIPLTPLNKQDLPIRGSVREYKKEFKLSKVELSSILYKSFGRQKGESTKAYPSAGGLYPVLSVLVVIENNRVPFLDKGSYVYDSRENELLLLKKFTPEDVNAFRKNVDMPWEVPGLAMAYAIDMKRAITKYKFRGYRHALIEVGLMSQAFRNSLWETSENLGECCWSGFSDNAVSHILGLSPRLAPVTLLQWFGEKQ